MADMHHDHTRRQASGISGGSPTEPLACRPGRSGDQASPGKRQRGQIRFWFQECSSNTRQLTSLDSGPAQWHFSGRGGQVDHPPSSPLACMCSSSLHCPHHTCVPTRDLQHTTLSFRDLRCVRLFEHHPSLFIVHIVHRTFAACLERPLASFCIHRPTAQS